jgi:hypothetical protein
MAGPEPHEDSTPDQSSRAAGPGIHRARPRRYDALPGPAVALLPDVERFRRLLKEHRAELVAGEGGEADARRAERTAAELARAVRVGSAPDRVFTVLARLTGPTASVTELTQAVVQLLSRAGRLPS